MQLTAPATGVAPPGTNTPRETGKNEGYVKVVEFLLGGDLYAIDLFDVKEVVVYTEISKIPNVPSYVRGIISLRREITLVIDIRELLHISSGPAQKVEKSRFIVLDEKNTKKKMGILVDKVLAVSTIPRDDIDTETTSMKEGHTSYAKGVIRKRIRTGDKETDQLVIWIDIRKMIGDIEREM